MYAEVHGFMGGFRVRGLGVQGLGAVGGFPLSECLTGTEVDAGS